MSLHIEFEPHSWYMGFAIKHESAPTREIIGKRGVSIAGSRRKNTKWRAFTDNGNTYQVDELTSKTLKNLKQQIKQYRVDEAKRIARLYEGEARRV